MKYIALTMLLAVMQAPPPVPRKTADNSAHAPAHIKGENAPDQAHPAPAPPSIEANSNGPAKSDSDDQHPEDAEHTVGISKLPPVTIAPIRRDWADWAYWAFNALLVGVGTFQVVLLLWTLRAVRHQAEAMIHAERPWVMIQTEILNPDDFAKLFVIFKVFNYGKGPAHIIDCKGPKGKWVKGEEDLVIPPDYGEWEWDKRFLAPRDDFQVRELLSPWQIKVQAAADSAIQGTAHKGEIFIAYGLIRYTDGISDKPYKTAYCLRFRHNRPSKREQWFIPFGPKPHNEYT